ncbi:MAG TPA: YqgE/AlgH family protein [Gemmataceae bacterium]|nr:YqgE/AlgH family protein [Gemmataceae bacterium]
MTSLAGKFLVARSSLRDAFFGRSVILLLQHSEEGAFGLVLTHQAKTEELPFPIFVGGPCKMDGLLMIHGRKDWLDPEEDEPAEICPGVYLGTPEQFEKARGTSDDATGFRVFTGYSGWAPEQLEGELNEGAWIVLPAMGDVIFSTPSDELWEKLAPPTLPEPSMN